MSNSNANDPLTSTVTVRLAGLEDAETIKTVINSAFRPAEGFFIETDRIDLEGVRSHFEMGKFLVAESDGVMLGCVYVEPHGGDERRAYLGLLSVDPERQGAGLGSMLMDAAEEFGRNLGCSFMDIKIVNLREGLSGFYRKRGYVETGSSSFPVDIETKLPCHFIDMAKPLIKL